MEFAQSIREALVEAKWMVVQIEEADCRTPIIGVRILGNWHPPNVNAVFSANKQGPSTTVL
jgi:hypothetical protein